MNTNKSLDVHTRKPAQKEQANIIRKMLYEGEIMIKDRRNDPEVALNKAENSVPYLCEK